MSWKERLENIKFTITTGDGKSFYPLWKVAEKELDFNVSRYDFIDVEGSFVDRKKAQGSKFPLVFYFQGDDNIEQCNDFEKSTKDNRLWTIEHPFYGTLKGQPTNLKRNDSFYNVTEIVVDFWESLTDDFPMSKTSVKDNVRAKVTSINELTARQIVENTQPSTSDISALKNQTTLTAAKFKPDALSFNDYVNIVKTGIKTTDDLITDTQTSIENLQKIVSAPADFYTSVNDKIKSYKDSYLLMKASITSLFDKYFFEGQASSVICGMCLAAVNPGDDEYTTRNEVEAVSDLINEIYADYLTTLDANQVSIYDVDNTWTPNINIQLSLTNLVSETLNGLFSLSFDARQERIYELLDDSNLIILTHRFVGLDADDKNIENFKKINGIKNDENFIIRKGRQIKYFV
jgi:hypothetical protein